MAATVPARFHRGTEAEPTQYLALHPLGPHAETIRNHDLTEVAQVRAFEIRTWALAVETDQLLEVDFDSAATFGISADALVADDYAGCHTLADDLRARNVPGIIVPSAALPGTRNIVLFGARVAAPYPTVPTSPVDVPASITGENGQPLENLLPQVRMIGAPHPALDAWTANQPFVFLEPDWELAA